MKILVVGSGGREHALVWKIAQSPLVREIYCAPGNPGMKESAVRVPIDPKDLKGLLYFVKKWGVDLTVVGPEQPLVDGIVDLFNENSQAIFGPTKGAAKIEGSKAFAKKLMWKYNIPTAPGQIFDDSNCVEANNFISRHGLPIVIKADGLAAGKGVRVCQTIDEARKFYSEVSILKTLGKAGDKVIIEDCLEGEEVSYLVLTDGYNFLPLATSRDHKPIFDGDQGDNTGGMGAYSPAPIVTWDVERKILFRIIRPIIKAMTNEGKLFKGVLYAGLIINKNGDPYVLEFNCRFGDPETQPILVRMKSDLVPILQACLKGNLQKHTIEWDERPAVCVVMSAQGYPGTPEKWDEIFGLKQAARRKDVTIFQAGTALLGDRLVTNGGRVLGVTALGDSFPRAIKNAYQAVEEISWLGAHYRTAIGAKALKYL